ncbi:hypothetical protein GALMADRAFT_222032 [Galerina marginata CBS 339.88]|uniref:Uncharacterized protein n=1 Tax=Galerina marginata (strain CBS 339.88) TaxID=685588 RepID=A0A067TT45_GALM3|nr:hypothetical protein GALMADRAFT_222032 [Galerina marginata CBS 339.88]
MAPRSAQGTTKSAGDKSTKKRPLSPEKRQTGHAANALVASGDEKPAKRQRSSTIGTKAAASVPATTTTAEKSKATEAQAEPVTNDESDSAEGSSEDEPEEEQPKFAGPFDLYATQLPFLHKVYSPAGSTAVFPEKLYKEILTYQAKNDRTAKVTIPERFTSGNDGKFRSGLLRDPMEEMPFDIIATNITQVDKLNLKLDYKRPDNAWDGPGLKADLEIEEEGCGIASSSGSLSFHPLWKKVDKDGQVMELFEGTFSFKVSYSSLYSRKGHGRGQSEAVGFWAVRGKA